MNTAYITLPYEQFMALTALNNGAKEVARQNTRHIDLLTEGEPLVAAFIRGFNFHAAGEPKPDIEEKRLPITAREMLTEYYKAFNIDPPQWESINSGAQMGFERLTYEINKRFAK